MKLTMAFASAGNALYGEAAAVLCTHHELPGVAGRINTFFMKIFTKTLFLRWAGGVYWAVQSVICSVAQKG